ncbi:MAG: hypothetical protein WA005_16515 [Candidatus Binataceae bacterium]
MKIGWVAAAVLLLVPVVSSPALADHFYTTYYDVASSVKKTGAGYGGLGASGGAGDSLVRIVNPTHSDTVQLGTICAMLYVFDDNEEMQACCGCPVTPDGLRTISVINQLTTNWGFNKGNLTAGVIDLVPSSLNWSAPFPTSAPPRGVGETSVTLGSGCDPSGGSTHASGGTHSTPVTGEGELKAWLNHTESMFASAASAPPIVSTSVEEFAGAYLDTTHLTDLENTCGFLLTSGSGAGVCSCGVGDSSSTFRPRP